MNDLRKIVSELPDQLQQTIEVEGREKISQIHKSLVVCGMGGSGIVGDIIHALLPTVPIVVHKSYGLPRAYPADSLFLIVSYSGETEETLSSYDQAIKEKKHIAVITGGGRLLERAKNEGVPYTVVPHAKEVPARFSVGPCMRAALEIMEAVGLVESVDELVEPTKNATRPEDGEVKRLARAIGGSTVLVYAAQELVGLAEIWKMILNETAKVPAFANTISEALHNEVESIGSIERPFILFLDDPQSDERIGKRFRAFEKLARKHDWPYTTNTLKHPERIVDLVVTTMFALLVGLEIAENKNIDPVQTPLIDELKK